MIKEQNGIGFVPDEGFRQRAELEVALADITGSLFMPSATFWTWQAQDDVLHFGNTGHIAVTGTLTEDLTLQHYAHNSVHPDDRELFTKSIAATLAVKSPEPQFSFFYRAIDAEGTYQWCLIKGSLVERDANGCGTHMLGLVIAAAILREEREKYTERTERMSFALEAARDGLWDWNTETNDMYYSPRYLAMLGYTSASFPPLLTSWFERVHKDDVEKSVRQHYMHINSPHYGDIYENIYRFLTADGSYRWILSRGKVVQRNSEGRGARVVGLHTDITELRHAQDSLKDIINSDHLTRLNSRFAFDEAFNKIEEAHFPVSLIYMDVDALKLVNDNLGHEAGDLLLVKAADLIRSAFRSDDTVARIGGDEFVALLPNCPFDVAKRLLEVVKETCVTHNEVQGNMPIFLSLGMASTEKGVDLYKLQSVADADMIHNKKIDAERKRIIINGWIKTYAERRTNSPRRKTASRQK